MDAKLERIITQYNRSRDRYFASFACVDMTMLHESGIIYRWVEEHNNGNDLVPGDIYAKLILKERLKQWKQKYNNSQESIDDIYNRVISN